MRLLFKNPIFFLSTCAHPRFIHRFFYITSATHYSFNLIRYRSDIVDFTGFLLGGAVKASQVKLRIIVVHRFCKYVFLRH